MTCCAHCCGIEREFDHRTAARDLKRYRRRGPLPTTRMLLSALERQGIGGASVLDVGGGVGAIHHELLRRGAARATHVDASSSYLAVAGEEARRQGHAGRVEFIHGDFVERAPQLEPADVVTLDRVICCYPDMHRLVGLSAERARRLYGVVFPRESWWMRPLFPMANGWFRLQRCPFRVFQHATDAVEEVVREAGLRRVSRQLTPIWQVVVYAR
jgi:2-polyprenyl-3-methyl-5-hydroxy-6-metoxy-1,4-benzoquinol methylase